MQFRNLTQMFAILAGALPVFASAQTLPPFPLSAHSVGVWSAVPWQSPGDPQRAPDFYARMKDIDFNIRVLNYSNDSAGLAKSLALVSQELATEATLTPPRYTVLELGFWMGNERTRATPALEDPSIYEKRIAFFLDHVNWQSPSVVGCSLSEENVPATNDRAVYLSMMYDYIHQHYPGLRVFQWYSPNTSVPKPVNGRRVPADGWILDPYTLCPQMYPDSQYHLGEDPYATILKEYLATNLPIIDVVCATSMNRAWFNPDDPKNKYHFDERAIMDHQFQVNQEYNVPTAFFWTSGMNPKNSIYFDRAEVTDPLMQEINNKVLNYVQTAHSGQ